MTMMEGHEKCSNPECGNDGTCSVQGSNAKWCVICRPYEEPGPCDRIIVVDEKEQPCGSTDDVIRFKTPNGTPLQRCYEHRKSHDLIKETNLGY